MTPFPRSFLIATLLLGACASSPEDRVQLEREGIAREVKDEQEIGRQMAAKLAGALGTFDADERLLRYLNLVGKTVASRSNRPELAYRFGILQSDEINAFAAPGGYIFVTRGLLREVQSEDELAGVLAHEVAHLTERHMHKEIMPKREVSAAETMTQMLSRGGSNIGFSMGKIVNQGMELLLEKGLGAEKEHEADQVGSMLAAAAGYDPTALERLLTRIGSQSATVKVSKTHPPYPARIKSLHGFLERNGLQKLPLQADKLTLQNRFAESTRSIRTRP